MTFEALLLLAIALSMDAFAVSICGGIVLPAKDRARSGIKFGAWFGFFQALMPIIGFYIGSSFAHIIKAYDHWVAFILLCYLGVNMLREASADVSDFKSYDVKQMLLLAIATSIDALAVGVTLAFLKVNILFAAGTIGCVTFAFSFCGCVFGSAIGGLWKKKAEMAGGIVLILIGLNILWEHFH